MGFGLTYISSEPEMPEDEYSQVLNLIFDVSGEKSNARFAELGVRNMLKMLESHVFPVPRVDDFAWFLRHTRPIGISNGSEIICVADNFDLDEFSHFDWIKASYNPPINLNRQIQNDFLGYVARNTVYKCLRYGWDKFDSDHG